jgi:hypothetical protein
LANIGGINARQILACDPAALDQQAISLAELDSVERIAHAARVGKMRLLDAHRQVFGERLARFGIECVALLALIQLYAPFANGPRLICMCPPGEDHEIGLLTFALLMGSAAGKSSTSGRM